MTRARLLVAVLALPILLLCASAWRAAIQSQQSTRWVLPIEGYDPRDVLRGHYIQFRYVLRETSFSDEDSMRLCLTGPTATPEAALRDEDWGLDDCTAIGRFHADHDGFRFDGFGKPGEVIVSGRLYIPEVHGAPLTSFLMDAKRSKAVVVEIAGNGRVTPVDLLIDGKPYRDLLQTQAATAP